MRFQVSISLTLFGFTQLIDEVMGHGRIWEPVSRATAFRKKISGAVADYNDHEGFCGGFTVQHQNGGKCGICGDSFSARSPRMHEAPGKYALKKIVQTYSSGQVISVEVELTVHHKGYFEFRICPNENFEKDPEQSCFEDKFKSVAMGSSDESLVDSDSDIDLAAMEEELANFRSPRQFCERQFEEDIPPRVFRERYRIPPEAIDYLCEKLGPLLRRTTKRNFPLSPRQQLLVLCNFLGTASFYHVVRDTFGIGKESARRVIHRAANALLTLREEVICWPQNPESVAVDFKKLAGFPCVAGVIDGTHCKVSPPKAVEANYLNRKQFHSINVLLVCGPDLSFYYANANMGGRAHDSRCLKMSSLWKTFEEEHQRPFPGAVLLGDLGFPLRPWLLTEFPTSEGAKDRFNRSLTRTRNIVERSIGVLKKRFYCLATGLRVRKMTYASDLIICCVILHNIAIRFGDAGEELDGEEETQEVEDQPANQEPFQLGREDRRNQILNYFASL